METTISILKQTYEVMAGAVTSAAPKLLATAIVVVLGLIAARAAKAIVHKLLEAVQFEDVAAKIGLSNVLGRADVSQSAGGIVCTMVSLLQRGRMVIVRSDVLTSAWPSVPTTV